MAQAREIPGIVRMATFREAAANAVEVRTEELFSFSEGVLDTADIERVHDMRVASRRLRAVLEVFASCFPKREFRRVLADVKRLADDLGARRDPDVAIATLERVSATWTAEDRPGVESLAADFAARQRAGNELLAKRLEAIEAGDLEGRLLDLAAGARSG